MNFIRKYIHIAKEMKPKLSSEACTAISEEYSRLRSQDNTNNDMAKVGARLPDSPYNKIGFVLKRIWCIIQKSVCLYTCVCCVAFCNLLTNILLPH